MVVNGGLPISQSRVSSERQMHAHSNNNSARMRIPPRLIDEPMAGFIFVCNDETITENFELKLFGSPKAHIESVKCIKKGMPLFLYNYNTKLMHGVFEAASDGDVNIDPQAWGTNFPYDNGSKFPAQVRFAVRELKAPINEMSFQSILYYYEAKKFRLELSHTQVSDLLKAFAGYANRNWSPDTEFRTTFRRTQGGVRETPPVSNAPPILHTPRLRPSSGLQETEELCRSENKDDPDCNSGSRSSYLAALKSGIPNGMEIINQNGTGTNGEHDAVGSQIEDPDSPDSMKNHQEVDSRKNNQEVDSRRKHQQQDSRMQGRTFNEPRRRSRDGRQTSTAPLVQTYSSFRHAPVVRPAFVDAQVAYGSGSPLYYGIIQLGNPPALSFPYPDMVGEFQSNYESLHKEILEFVRSLRPSEEYKAWAVKGVNCLRSVVKSLWPEASVEIFGSFATGLCLRNSDVDVVVLNAPRRNGSTGTSGLILLLRELAAECRRFSWCKSLENLETAATPLIKLVWNPSADKDSGVHIDITIGGEASSVHNGIAYVHNGIAAKDFVVQKLTELPALAPLVYVIKAYLERKGLKHVYRGGLGSFALTLMVIFFLEDASLTWSSFKLRNLYRPGAAAPTQTRSSGAAPAPTPSSESSSSFDSDEETNPADSTSTNTSEDSARPTLGAATDEPSTAGDEPHITRAWKTVDANLSSCEDSDALSLGSLLIAFLHLFGAYDFSVARMVLKGVNGKEWGMIPASQPAIVWIDDPIRPGNNVASGSFKMSDVQQAWIHMLCVVARPDMGPNRHGCLFPHLDPLLRGDGGGR